MLLSDIHRAGSAGVLFDEEQLLLPLEHESASAVEPYRGNPSIEPPHDVLSDYLRSVGVSNSHSLATLLLHEFRSLSAVLAASSWRLRKLVGPRLCRIIRSTRELLEASLQTSMADRPILSTSEAVIAFIQAHSGSLTRERVTAIYVDSLARLLRVQVISDGGVGSAQLDSGAILRWGLDVGAAGFLLVHNHPSGDPTPSRDDRIATARLSRLAAELEMPLLRHLIVAHGRVAFVDHERVQEER